MVPQKAWTGPAPGASTPTTSGRPRRPRRSAGRSSTAAWSPGGDDVTAYGLAVEHDQKSEVVWSGQGGTDVFFQNELPYDPPSQAVWNESATFSGYPAFRPATDTTDANNAPVDVVSYP